MTDSYNQWGVEQVAGDAKEAICRVSDSAFDPGENANIPTVTYEVRRLRAAAAHRDMHNCSTWMATQGNSEGVSSLNLLSLAMQLPDGTQIEIGPDRFAVPEVLFTPVRLSSRCHMLRSTRGRNRYSSFGALLDVGCACSPWS
jgi:Actin